MQLHLREGGHLLEVVFAGRPPATAAAAPGVGVRVRDQQLLAALVRFPVGAVGGVGSFATAASVVAVVVLVHDLTAADDARESNMDGKTVSKR